MMVPLLTRHGQLALYEVPHALAARVSVQARCHGWLRAARAGRALYEELEKLLTWFSASLWRFYPDDQVLSEDTNMNRQ